MEQGNELRYQPGYRKGLLYDLTYLHLEEWECDSPYGTLHRMFEGSHHSFASTQKMKQSVSRFQHRAAEFCHDNSRVPVNIEFPSFIVSWPAAF